MLKDITKPARLIEYVIHHTPSGKEEVYHKWQRSYHGVMVWLPDGQTKELSSNYTVVCTVEGMDEDANEFEEEN